MTNCQYTQLQVGLSLKLLHDISVASFLLCQPLLFSDALNRPKPPFSVCQPFHVELYWCVFT